MGLIAALQALSTTGIFASRAFTPLFALVAIARWPATVNWIPLVPERPVALTGDLSWLGSDIAVATLAVLSLLELIAERSSEARELLALAEPAVKAAAAVVAVLALGGSETADLLRGVTGGPVLLLPQASPGLARWALALGAGGGVFVLARWRLALLENARRLDADTELHLSRWLAVVEQGWAAFGMALVLVAPLLALLVSGVAIAILAAASRAARLRELARRLPCDACPATVRPESARCRACGSVRLRTQTPSSRAWPDRWLARPSDQARDRLDLVADSRCPGCAERRASRELLGSQPHDCGWTEPPDDGLAPAEQLILCVRARAVRLAIVTAVLGIVPVVGAAIAIVAGRLRVAAPLARHANVGPRLVGRWTGRILVLGLLLGSGLPLASALTGPAIVAVLFVTQRKALRTSVRQ